MVFGWAPPSGTHAAGMVRSVPPPPACDLLGSPTISSRVPHGDLFIAHYEPWSLPAEGKKKSQVRVHGPSLASPDFASCCSVPPPMWRAFPHSATFPTFLIPPLAHNCGLIPLLWCSHSRSSISRESCVGRAFRRPPKRDNLPAKRLYCCTINWTVPHLSIGCLLLLLYMDPAPLWAPTAATSTMNTSISVLCPSLLINFLW